jgi:glycogen(starch) synthase
MAEMRKGRGRGRVVMLVDNGVEGDSRVQKEARSAAERGWDVVLLGRSPDRKPRTWQLGDAQVRLVPMAAPLATRRYEYRRAPLRSPLAYPEGRLPAYVRQKAAARKAEAQTKLAIHHEKIRTGRRSGAAALPGRVWVRLNRMYADKAADLVDLRLRKTEQLRERRERLDAPLDRFTTAFWQKTMGVRAWRKLEPNLWDWELAFGPVIDRLQPDLIHANDSRMVGIGARAALRARHAGRDVKLVWDAHEYLPGRYVHNAHPRWKPAHVAYEHEFVGYADAVVTVSEMMVDLLRADYGLEVPIEIVRNAPSLGQADAAERPPSIRELCGLSEDVPLLLYAGAMAPQRGNDLMIEALPRLEGVHHAFLARQSRYVEGLLARAEELGVRDRVHVHPYVPVDQIVGHIRSADVGVLASLKYFNHEVDLPTKFYEYAHAGLPMVASDVRTTAETVERLGIGEVFHAEDLEGYVRAVREVLADRDRYRKAYDKAAPLLEEWVWDRQADVLDSVYASLVPPRT